ncbi:hypothetical protein [Breoghania sp.]|uniref:hypothetical protein n=1 Tax=Breoghania sp. TaxID=2065378 RepID=UPI002636F707|nr:hypothetical protein [Breoghania sp.]
MIDIDKVLLCLSGGGRAIIAMRASICRPGREPGATCSVRPSLRLSAALFFGEASGQCRDVVQHGLAVCFWPGNWRRTSRKRAKARSGSPQLCRRNRSGPGRARNMTDKRADFQRFIVAIFRFSPNRALKGSFNLRMKSFAL